MASEWFVAMCQRTFLNDTGGTADWFVLMPATPDVVAPDGTQVTAEARAALVALGWTPPEEER